MKVNVWIMLTTLQIVWIGFGTPDQMASGQTLNGPMKLMPVEVEDVDAPRPEQPIGNDWTPDASEPPDAPTSDETVIEPGDESNIFDSLPVPLEPATVTDGNPMDQMATGTTRKSRLEVLNKPLSAFQLTNLSRPPFVPRQSFTVERPRLITASEASDLSSLKERTTYCRRRLYFEDATLERCGYSDWVTSVGILTNAHSAAQFMFDTVTLPCRMIKNRPDELVRSSAQ